MDILKVVSLHNTKSRLQCLVQSLKVKVETQKKQLEILHSIFERYKLEDGIHLDELFPMLKMLGLKLSRDELDHFMEQLGVIGESLVRPDTFLLILLDQFFCIKDQKSEVLDAFKVFEREELGSIKQEELQWAMSLGNALNEEEYERLLEITEVFHKGNLDYAEITKLMLNCIIIEADNHI